MTPSQEIDQPLFIVGASRSGTTLLRLMLNAHPRLAVPHEFKYFREVREYASPEAWRAEFDDASYTELVDNFLAAREHIFDEIGIVNVKRKILADPERTIRGPYRVGAQTWMEFYGKSRWGEKTPFNLFYVDLLLDMFPEAKFIYVVRDPRAVVTSMNTIEYFSDDSVINALNWKTGAGEAYHNFVSAIPEASRMKMSYEQLATDPADTLGRLCTFAGEQYDDSMLSFYRDSKRYMNPVIRTENVTKTVTSTSIERWREHLSKSEVAMIEHVCADEMKLHGYDREGGKPTLSDKMSIALKTRYFEKKMAQNSHTPGYNVPYGEGKFSRVLNKLGM